MHQRKENDGRCRLHPAKCTVEELIQRLDTDPVRGLSHKDADRRMEKNHGRPLFENTEKPFASHLKSAFREPVLWILLAVCAVAMFFDRVAVGFVCLALSLIHACICAWMSHMASRLDGEMQGYDAPLARVIRNGRTTRISGNHVVPGDVLVLRPGDVVSADVRLLFSNGLVVTEHRIGGSPNVVQVVQLAKDATAMPETPTFDHSPENMVFAGAVVEAGGAEALVVAVGEKTHLGAMSGGLSPAHTTCTPHALLKARKYVSFWNLAAVGVILPVTVIGIFTLGRRFDLLDLFLTSLAFATVSLTEHVMAKGVFLGARVRSAAAHHRDVEQSADIKSSRILEQLGDMTHLLLVGTAGLHDGLMHPTSVLVGDQSYGVGRAEDDPALTRLSELLYLWKKGVESGKGSPRQDTASVFLAVDDINEWIVPDVAALSVRTEGLVERWGEVAVKLRGQSPMYVRVTTDFAEVEDCSLMASTEGQVSFEGAAKYEWYRAYGKAVKEGKRVFFLISDTENVACAEAMLIMSTRVCRKTKGCIDDLEDAGITVVAFLHDVSEENTSVLEACGLTEKAPADRPPENGERTEAARLIEQGVRAFEGCDADYILQYMETVRAAGGRVGVLSVERGDIPLLSHADTAITCAPRQADINRGTLMRENHGVDGCPDSVCATDLARRCAHVIIRRSHVHGGGVCALRHALLTAARFRSGLQGAARFILLSQFIRLAAVLLSLIPGVTLLTAPSVLLSGLVVDLAVVICYAFADLPSIPDDPATGGAATCLHVPHVMPRREWIAVGVSAVLPWIVAGVARIMGGAMGTNMVYFAFLTLMGGQLAVFLTGHPPRRSRLTFLTAMLMVCLFAGALAVALGSGLGIMWCFVWPFLQPVAYLAIRGIYRVMDFYQNKAEEH